MSSDKEPSLIPIPGKRGSELTRGIKGSVLIALLLVFILLGRCSPLTVMVSLILCASTIGGTHRRCLRDTNDPKLVLPTPHWLGRIRFVGFMVEFRRCASVVNVRGRIELVFTG